MDDCRCLPDGAPAPIGMVRRLCGHHGERRDELRRSSCTVGKGDDCDNLPRPIGQGGRGDGMGGDGRHVYDLEMIGDNGVDDRRLRSVTIELISKLMSMNDMTT